MGARVGTVSGREVSSQAVRPEKPAAHTALGGHIGMAAPGGIQLPLAPPEGVRSVIGLLMNVHVG